MRFFQFDRPVLLAGLICCLAYTQGAAAAPSSTQVAQGAEIFLKYCSGCHGTDGFAEYEHAPSFSMGDRLHKSDEELLASVLRGRHGMPYWNGKLSASMYRSAIAYLRVMAERYQSGLPPRNEPLPDYLYQFRPVGEPEHYWETRD